MRTAEHPNLHSPQQARPSALAGGDLRRALLVWLLSLLICAVAVTVAFVYFDVPVALYISGFFPRSETLTRGFASVVLLAIEAAVVLALIILRIRRGHLSPFRETVALACLASICAYAINDGTLKYFFGVPNPSALVDGARHTFHLLGGSPNSSFPSGHMVLAGSFAAVFMRMYRRSILPFSALLLLAALLLVGGEWHFVSDVLAGTFLGITAGLLAGEVWLAHTR